VGVVVLVHERVALAAADHVAVGEEGERIVVAAYPAAARSKPVCMKGTLKVRH
jgi:hypothetical protein